jgi:hypothetical protein
LTNRVFSALVARKESRGKETAVLPDELAQVQSGVKDAVQEALSAWPVPAGRDLGRIWTISVSALAIATLVIIGSMIVFLWNNKGVTELMSLATLLLGAFIGWLGGSKANPAP